MYILNQLTKYLKPCQLILMGFFYVYYKPLHLKTEHI